MNLKGKILFYSFECLSVIFDGDTSKVLRWTGEPACARDITVGVFTLIAIIGVVLAFCSFLAYKILVHKFDVKVKRKIINVLRVLTIVFFGIFVVMVIVNFCVCLFA